MLWQILCEKHIRIRLKSCLLFLCLFECARDSKLFLDTHFLHKFIFFGLFCVALLHCKINSNQGRRFSTYKGLTSVVNILEWIWRKQIAVLRCFFLHFEINLQELFKLSISFHFLKQTLFYAFEMLKNVFAAVYYFHWILGCLKRISIELRMRRWYK